MDSKKFAELLNRAIIECRLVPHAEASVGAWGSKRDPWPHARGALYVLWKYKGIKVAVSQFTPDVWADFDTPERLYAFVLNQVKEIPFNKLYEAAVLHGAKPVPKAKVVW